MSATKAQRRVLMLGLDGCEWSIAERMMREGRLPATARLVAESVRMALDHGGARRTGLAWEHVSTGLSPDDARRWAAVDFDPARYLIRQRATNLAPFTAGLDARVVVVDPPYFDLAQTDAQGLVGWGAHDPGVPACSAPADLLEEVRARFGPYRAKEWIYGFVWPSARKARRMADDIVQAVEQRAALTLWMLKERFPDWQLGYAVVSEYHSAVEALWHGVDADHPLHGLPSAAAAKDGIEGVYEAGDRMIAALREAFPDAALVVFNLHGMGPNNSDNGSMVLLAELMFRRECGRPLMRPGAWPTTPTGAPLLREGQLWRREVNRLYQSPFEEAARRAFGRRKKTPGESALDWMPATRYRPYWPRMRAFALPSFYDGRIRINLKGREADGRVTLDRYEQLCDEYVTLLSACRDPVSGAPAVERVERRAGDPMSASESEPDLTVIWSKAAPLGLSHPEIGDIGPLPYRRTGGHTGGHGFAFVHGAGLAAGDYGLRSAFDVAPTVLDLMQRTAQQRVSGQALDLTT